MTAVEFSNRQASAHMSLTRRRLPSCETRLLPVDTGGQAHGLPRQKSRGATAPALLRNGGVATDDSRTGDPDGWVGEAHERQRVGEAGEADAAGEDFRGP